MQLDWKHCKRDQCGLLRMCTNMLRCEAVSPADAAPLWAEEPGVTVREINPNVWDRIRGA